MMITRNNYEAYMLDWMEGNLTEQQIAALLRFLDENPDLDATLPEFLSLDDQAHLSDQERSSLFFDSIHEGNKDHFFTAYVEGELTKVQLDQLEMFLIDHPNFQKELDRFKLAVLIPDVSIIYSNKLGLVQPVVDLKFYMVFLRYAAVLVLLLTFSYVLFFYSDSTVVRYSKSHVRDLKGVGYLQDDLELTPLLSIDRDEENQLVSFPKKKVVVGEDLISMNEYSESFPPVESNIIPIPELRDVSETNDMSLVIEEDRVIQEEMAKTPPVPIQDWALTTMERRARLALDVPEHVQFENGLYTAASLGLTAITNKQQEIGRKSDHFKTTKIEFAGVKFERIVRR